MPHHLNRKVGIQKVIQGLDLRYQQVHRVHPFLIAVGLFGWLRLILLTGFFEIGDNVSFSIDGGCSRTIDGACSSAIGEI